MSNRDAWRTVFPTENVSKAAGVLFTTWHDLAKNRKSHFNNKTREPNLTETLTNYLKEVVQIEKKMIGHWDTECPKAKVNRKTGQCSGRIRTDIEYKWNDSKKNYQVVFEFKILKKNSSSHSHYCGENGMMRFVTGEYSKGDPIAFMVGIFVEEKDDCVEPLRKRIQTAKNAAELKMIKQADDELLIVPSKLLPHLAGFDTEHIRDKIKAPAHGSIYLTHVFVGFGYSP